MKLLARLLLLAALISLGFWAWRFFFPSPESVIHKRINKLAQLASFSNEGNIARVANVERMGAFFTEEVEVTVDVPGEEAHSFNRRDELMQAALQARTALGSLKVEFPEIHISVDPGGTSAMADVTLYAHIGGQNEPIVQELKIDFQKMDRAWLIKRVAVQKTVHH